MSSLRRQLQSHSGSDSEEEEEEELSVSRLLMQEAGIDELHSSSDGEEESSGGGSSDPEESDTEEEQSTAVEEEEEEDGEEATPSRVLSPAGSARRIKESGFIGRHKSFVIPKNSKERSFSTIEVPKVCSPRDHMMGMRRPSVDGPLREARALGRSSSTSSIRKVPKPRSQSGQEAFDHYARKSDSKAALAALDAGHIDVNDSFTDRTTLLHMACKKGHKSLVQELLKRGARTDAVTKKSLSTPLHMVAASDSMHLILRALVHARADVHAVDVNGYTPMHWAAEQGALMNAHQLLTYGARVDKPSATNSTAAQLAAKKHPREFLLMSCAKKHVKLCEEILSLSSSVDVTFTGPSGDTAVLIACKNVCTEECVQWLECMRAMLELGGVEALRTANKDGESPLQVALTSSVSSYLRKSLLEAVVGVCYSAKTKTMDLQEMQLSDFSGQLLATLGGFTIKTLDLRKNRFRMLPLNLGTVLPKLDRILLDGNPLDLLPEHARHSWHKLSNYFDSVTMRSLSFNERKVMVVGEEATGKTTLTRSIASKHGKTSVTENLATDGIEIKENISISASNPSDNHLMERGLGLGLRRLTRVNPFEGQQDFATSLWDLGGQTIFYPSHQFFLTASCVYVVTFNLSDPHLSRVEYWLRLLRSLAFNKGGEGEDMVQKGLAVYIVGTHADRAACTPEHVQAVTKEIQDSFPRCQFPFLKGILFLSCATGQGVQELKQTLFSQFSRSPISVPESWVLLYDFIRAQKGDQEWVSLASFKQGCRAFDIDPLEDEKVLRFLANTGLVTHLSCMNGNSDLIILQPSWLSRVMTSVITIRPSWVRHGILERKHVDQAFRGFPEEVHQSLLELMEQFSILFRMRQGGGERFIIPALLPEEPDREEWAAIWPQRPAEGTMEQGRIFRFPFLPIGLFNRLVVHVLQISQLRGKMFWQRGAVVQLHTQSISRSLKDSYGGQDSTHVALMFFNEKTCELHLHVRSNAPSGTDVGKEKLLSRGGLLARLVSDSLASVLENYNMGHCVFRLVKCSHCLDMMSHTEPDLLLPPEAFVNPFSSSGGESTAPASTLSDVVASAVGSEKTFLFTYHEILDAIKSGRGFMFCNHIRSPKRMVSINRLAPDLAFVDMQAIRSSSITLGPCIGEGGFGKVFKGTLLLQDGTKVPIAAKELIFGSTNSVDPAQLSLGEAEAHRMGMESSFDEFQQEALLMSALSHPNLVKFYGIVRKPALQLVMEYVPQGDLFTLLHPKIEREDGGDEILLDEKGIPLPTRTTLAVKEFPWRLRLLMAWDMAKGMHHLHTMDPPVVHRDLRSPNIFLASLSDDPRQARAKVADFGMSRRVSTPMQAALATFRWVAPETMSSSKRKTYDERSDIYSFGIVCWEIATRQYPYDEFLLPDETGTPPMEQHQLLREIARGLRPSPPPPEEGCPQAFAQLISDCWQTEPELRPPFSAIVERLEAMLELDDVLLPSRVVRVTGLTSSAEELEERQEEKVKTRRALKLSDGSLKQQMVRTRKLTEDSSSLQFLSVVKSGTSLSLPAAADILAAALLDGRYLWLGCGTGFIRIFDLSSPAPESPVFAWKAHRSAVLFLTAVPARGHQEETEVWSCSQDGTVCLWSYSPRASSFAKLCTTGEPFGSLRAAFPSARSIGVGRCVASPTAVWVVSDTSPALVQVLDGRCIEVLHVVGRFPDVTAVVSLGNGQTWIASANRLLVFDTRTVELLAQWEAHEAPITALVASAEASGGGGWQSAVSSRTVWSGDASGRYQVWAVSGARISKEYDSGAVNAGSRICCAAQTALEMWLGYDSGDVLVCSMETLRPLHEIQAHASAVTTIQALPGRRVVVTTSDEEARTWEWTDVVAPAASAAEPSPSPSPAVPPTAVASTAALAKSASWTAAPHQQPCGVVMGLQRRAAPLEQRAGWASANHNAEATAPELEAQADEAAKTL